MNQESFIRFQRWLHDFKKKQQEKERKFGKLKPIMHAELNNMQFVAVGNEVHYSPNWKTFPDFLMTYIWHVLGREWAEIEIKKPLEDRHEILKWYDGVAKFHQKQTPNDDGLIVAKPNGVFAAFLLLAYDLYIIRHHQDLQAYVINRLRKVDQFQGARYELYATSTCIRAGFDIQFEDEQDRSKSHVEFIAVDKESGQRLSVEAKSKHRKGVLGQKGDKVPLEKNKTKVVSLINQALKKNSKFPLILFVDLNLPIEISDEMFKQQPPGEIVKLMQRVAKSDDGRDKFHTIIFTNNPHHYAEEDEPDPRKHYLFVHSLKPEKHIKHAKAIEFLERAVEQYGNIPSEFPDKDERVF